MTRQDEDELFEGLTVEPETRGDSASLFRLFVDHKLVGASLTAAEVHGLIGDILERVALPQTARTIALDELNASNDE